MWKKEYYFEPSITHCGPLHPCHHDEWCDSSNSTPCNDPLKRLTFCSLDQWVEISRKHRPQVFGTCSLLIIVLKNKIFTDAQFLPALIPCPLIPFIWLLPLGLCGLTLLHRLEVLSAASRLCQPCLDENTVWKWVQSISNLFLYTYASFSISGLGPLSRTPTGKKKTSAWKFLSGDVAGWLLDGTCEFCPRCYCHYSVALCTCPKELRRWNSGS